MWFKVGCKQSSKFPSISVNDCTLKSVQRQKYSGVVFDCTLSWTYHVSQVCKKMSYYLYLIGCHKHCLDAGLIKLLLDALVLSHLHYSLPVWGPALSQQSLHRLEHMQNWAVRMTMGLSRFDHVSQYYQQLNWLPVKKLIQFQSCCLMFRQCHQVKCFSLSPLIRFGRCHSHDTRTSDYFANSQRVRLAFTQKFFSFAAPHWWNAIPIDLYPAIKNLRYQRF